MMAHRKHITVYEHDRLLVGQGLAQDQFEALKGFFGNGVPWFSLLPNGVKFGAYVGVLQVGDTLYEVLPKADRGREEGQHFWRDRLVGMVQASGFFRVHAPTSASLSFKPDSLLDLYFLLFVEELEILIHKGLVKKYRRTEGNLPVLKGSLVFGKHLQQNLVHQEHFYVRHTTYDREHLLHQLLYKALKLVNRLNARPSLASRIGALFLDFPEMPDCAVAETTFRQIVLNRKTAPYRTALDIAELLLLNYHPDVRRGHQHALALMFDMNLLWEKFVLASLRGLQADGWEVSGQTSDVFWRSTAPGYTALHIRPDILLTRNHHKVVLDTKWKLPDNLIPAAADLHQMFAYQALFAAGQVLLLYPGTGASVMGSFAVVTGAGGNCCGVITIPVEEKIAAWQAAIRDQVRKALLPESSRFLL